MKKLVVRIFAESPVDDKFIGFFGIDEIMLSKEKIIFDKLSNDLEDKQFNSKEEALKNAKHEAIIVLKENYPNFSLDNINVKYL